MKLTSLLPLFITGLSCLLVAHALAQSTNSAPSGVTVIQPAAQTVTTYTPAMISANPTQTTALTSTYLSPLLTSLGVTVPSGAVTRTFTVTYFSDGSSASRVIFCASGSLPAPPVGSSSNAP